MNSNFTADVAGTVKFGRRTTIPDISIHKADGVYDSGSVIVNGDESQVTPMMYRSVFQNVSDKCTCIVTEVPDGSLHCYTAIVPKRRGDDRSRGSFAHSEWSVKTDDKNVNLIENDHHIYAILRVDSARYFMVNHLVKIYSAMHIKSFTEIFYNPFLEDSPVNVKISLTNSAGVTHYDLLKVALTKVPRIRQMVRKKKDTLVECGMSKLLKEI